MTTRTEELRYIVRVKDIALFYKGQKEHMQQVEKGQHFTSYDEAVAIADRMNRIRWQGYETWTIQAVVITTFYKLLQG